jgi:hypothetical protein
MVATSSDITRFLRMVDKTATIRGLIWAELALMFEDGCSGPTSVLALCLYASPAAEASSGHLGCVLSNRLAISRDHFPENFFFPLYTFLLFLPPLLERQPLVACLGGEVEHLLCCMTIPSQ